jgi:hypothetical protein
VKSKRTRHFRQLLRQLPQDAQRQAGTAYRLFKRDPHHPSLHFKRVGRDEPIYSVRIGIGYRALGLRDEADLIVWLWIGTHAEYDKLLSRLQGYWHGALALDAMLVSNQRGAIIPSLDWWNF